MKLKFKHTKMQSRKLERRLKKNETFNICFKKQYDITEDLWDDLQYYSHRIFVIHGETGSFKSSVGLLLCSKLDKHFSVKRIGFANREIRHISANSKEGEAFMRDENPHESGGGSGIASSQVHTLSEILRDRGNSLVFISPSLDYSIRTAHYILHTIDATHFEVEVKEMEKGLRKVEDVYVRVGIQDPLTLDYLGSMIFKLDINSPLWKKYIRKKREFLQLAPKMEHAQDDYTQIAMDLLKKIDLSEFVRYKNNKIMFKKGLFKVALKQKLQNKYSSPEIKDIYVCAVDYIEKNQEILENL